MRNTHGQLAIHGGIPAKQRPMPPMYPGGMALGAEEEQAVIDVIRRKRLYRYYGPEDGPSKTAEFEEAFAHCIGVEYALAVSSGTAALICALVGAGVGPGDEVIVPAYTWISTATAVTMVGGIPVIVEIDDSLTLDLADVRRKITPLTRAIIPVHMRGASADMDGVMSIAHEHDLAVIEDVAQAIGGSYHGRRLGSIGDLGIFSLQFNKIITTGEGGLVTTNDRTKWLRALAYHDPISVDMGRGISIEEAPPFGGQNYRASELVGAIGLVQLSRLDGLIAAMRDHKQRILAGLQTISGLRFRRLLDIEGDAAICVVLFLPTPDKAREFSKVLSAENIYTRNLYCADKRDYHVYSHWHHILNKVGTTPANFPWKRAYYKGAVNYSKDMCPRTLELLGCAVQFDVSPHLTAEDINEIVIAVKKVANAVL